MRAQVYPLAMSISTRWLQRLTLILAASTLLACVSPSDRRPGTWLTGEKVAGPITDWRFTDQHGEIFIQLKTPYLIPHSVTIVCTTLDGQLIVGARNPDSKSWPSYVDRNPEVRIKVGDRLYDQQLERIDDSETLEAVVRAYARKYKRPVRPPEERPAIRYWRVVERSGS